MKKTTHTRISTALPKDLLTQIDILVKTARYPSRSAFIEEALARRLREHGEIVPANDIQPPASNEKPDVKTETNASDMPSPTAEETSPPTPVHQPEPIHSSSATSHHD